MSLFAPLEPCTEPVSSILDRTQEWAGQDRRVACCRCHRVGGSLIDRVCGHCLGVTRGSA